MLDCRNNTLRIGDLVAYATTRIPGRSTHAVLKIGRVKKIAMGKRKEYVSIEVLDKGVWCYSVPIFESEKLIRLESAK